MSWKRIVQPKRVAAVCRGQLTLFQCAAKKQKQRKKIWTLTGLPSVKGLFQPSVSRHTFVHQLMSEQRLTDLAVVYKTRHIRQFGFDVFAHKHKNSRIVLT